MEHITQPPFTRPRTGRVVTGASTAVATRLGVSTTLVRFGFAAATLFGGLGLVAYLLVTVSTPTEGAALNPFQQWIVRYDESTGNAGRLGWWILSTLMLAVVAALSFLQGPFVILGLLALGAWLLVRPAEQQTAVAA